MRYQPLFTSIISAFLSLGIAQDKGLAEQMPPAATEPSIPDLLQRDLERNEAIVWYLHHSGWAAKTKDHFLIFDYHKGDRKAGKSLAEGYINPTELKDQTVYVFVSHSHGDHYTPRIFKWEKEIEDITYVFGWELREGPNYANMGPRKRKKLDGVEISTIASVDLGVGFLVKVDGVVIFHAGDHIAGEGYWEPFTEEIDYLARNEKEIDIAFVPTVDGGCRRTKGAVAGAFHCIGILQPKIMFPMHGGGCEEYYRDFAQKAAEKDLKTEVHFAESPGDKFFYKNGEIE